MTLLANRRILVEEGVLTAIVRPLSSKSKVLVNVGQEVAPDQIIAENFISAGFRNINLSSMLEVSPQDAKKYLQRPIGQKIYKGELLAFKPPQFFKSRKIVTSPSDASIDSYDEKSGSLRLSFLAKKVSTPSAVYGVVEKIDPIAGQVLIRTEVAKVYGVVGSGNLREGILNVTGDSTSLTKALQLKKEYEGDIVVAGSLIYKDALSQAVKLGIKGIICGGINAKDYLSMSGGKINTTKLKPDVGISVLITEGFGGIPINNEVFEVLKRFNNSFAIIDGNNLTLTLPSCDESCMIKIKKTQLAPKVKDLQVGLLPEIIAVELAVGQRVRIISSSFMGQTGKVISIDKTATKLPSGINTYQVLVETRSKKVKVPYPNLEVI